MSKITELHTCQLKIQTNLSSLAIQDISGALNVLLADVFAIYIKTKNFHWHMSGSHFRDYHVLLDDQGKQLHSMADPIAERVRKTGGTTLHSISQISKMQRIIDNNEEHMEPFSMLIELCEDNKMLAMELQKAHEICAKHSDYATASLIENWIDETEHRVWFLFETCH